MNDDEAAEIFQSGWAAGYQAGTDTSGAAYDEAWKEGYDAGKKDATAEAVKVSSGWGFVERLPRLGRH